MSYNIDCGVAMLIVYFLHMQLFTYLINRLLWFSGDLQDFISLSYESMDVNGAMSIALWSGDTDTVVIL